MVYLLAHSYPIQDNEFEEKLIGFYSTLDNAKQAILRLTTQNGFKNYPNDFVIRCLTLNEYFECDYLRDCGEAVTAVAENIENSQFGELDIIDFLIYEHSYQIADDIWQDDVKFFGVFDKQIGSAYYASLKQRFTQGELFVSSYRLDTDHWEEGFVTVSY
ncbi:hypothetical protein ACK1U4_10710 [Moraxella sp. TY6]